MDGNDSSAFWKERLLERVAEDHRRFEEAAVEVEAMGEPDGLGAFDGLVSRACDELLIHGTVVPVYKTTSNDPFEIPLRLQLVTP